MEGRERRVTRKSTKTIAGLGRQFCGKAKAVQDEMSLNPPNSQKRRRQSLAACNSGLLQRWETEAGELLEDQTPASLVC